MKIVERSLGFTLIFARYSRIFPPSASEDVSMRTSRSSTSNVVVAYVSMTCTPFRSSMVSPGRAARPRTYSFRAIRAGAAGPWLQGKAGARVGFLWPADLPTAGAWIGPHRCAGAGRSGRGGGPGGPPGRRPGPPDLGAPTGPTRGRPPRPAASGPERLPG